MFFIDRNINAIYNLSERPVALPAAWKNNQHRAEDIWEVLTADHITRALQFVRNPRYMRGVEGLAGLTDGKTIWFIPEALLIWAEDSPEGCHGMNWYKSAIGSFIIGTDEDNHPICAIRPLFAETP